MKKSLVLLALFSGLSFAFGQGQVNLVNSFDTLVSTNSISGPGLMSGPVGQYDFALFWAPVGITDPKLFEFSGYYGTNQAVAGRFTGGLGTAHAPAIAGQPPGSTVNVLFRGWSYDPFLGNPVNGDSMVWDRVKLTIESPSSSNVGWNWQYGESSIGTVILGGGTAPIWTPFGAFDSDPVHLIHEGMLLQNMPIPEPGTTALAGLVAAGLLLCRRKAAR